MKNIAAVIAIHGRETITLKTVHRLKQQTYPIEHVILVGDTPQEQSIAEITDSIFVKHPNTILGAKWQFGIDYAKTLNVDAVLIIGSDDWLTDNWVATMMGHIENGYNLVGKNSIYFLHIDKTTKQMLK